MSEIVSRSPDQCIDTPINAAVIAPANTAPINTTGTNHRGGLLCFRFM